MKVFSDLHHTALFYSLQLLFEKRLDGELYRPIGEEWYHRGYWELYPGIHPHTVKQYLTLEQCFKRDVHGFELPERMKLNEHYEVTDGIHYVFDPSTQKVQRAITVDKFAEMDFDIIISSVPSHIPRFNKLINDLQPQARHIFQVGNAWGHQPGVKNILASTAPFNVPGDINACFYHQEFDLDIFRYVPPTNHKSVRSFIHYMRGMDIHHQYRNELIPKGWDFFTYGAGMEGDLCYMGDIAKKYQEMGWMYHFKPEGDGYGHNLYNCAASGRPMIIWGQHYQGKLGNELLQDQRTCLDISRYTVHGASQLLEKFAQPDNHLRMCENARRQFNRCVSFDDEFENHIKPFLNRLR